MSLFGGARGGARSGVAASGLRSAGMMKYHSRLAAGTAPRWYRADGCQSYSRAPAYSKSSGISDRSHAWRLICPKDMPPLRGIPACSGHTEGVPCRILPGRRFRHDDRRRVPS